MLEGNIPTLRNYEGKANSLLNFQKGSFFMAYFDVFKDSDHHFRSN